MDSEELKDLLRKAFEAGEDYANNKYMSNFPRPNFEKWYNKNVEQDEPYRSWSTQLEALTDTPRPLWAIKSISSEEVVLEAGNQTITMTDSEWIREFVDGGAEEGMSVELEVD